MSKESYLTASIVAFNEVDQDLKATSVSDRSCTGFALQIEITKVAEGYDRRSVIATLLHI